MHRSLCVLIGKGIRTIDTKQYFGSRPVHPRTLGPLTEISDIKPRLFLGISTRLGSGRVGTYFL